MSLAELVVAMSMLVLLGTLLSAVAIVTTRSAAVTQVGLDNSAQTEQGMGAVSRVLRTAVLPQQLEDQVCLNCEKRAIVVASSTCIQFYANMRSATAPARLSRVTVAVIRDLQRGDGSGRLIQIVEYSTGSSSERRFGTAPDCAKPGDLESGRTLARGLVIDSAVPPFGYYDFSNAPLPSSPTADQRRQVASIDVVLRAQTRPGVTRLAASVRTAVQRVRLPNAELVYNEEAAA